MIFCLKCVCLSERHMNPMRSFSCSANVAVSYRTHSITRVSDEEAAVRFCRVHECFCFLHSRSPFIVRFALVRSATRLPTFSYIVPANQGEPYFLSAAIFLSLCFMAQHYKILLSVRENKEDGAGDMPGAHNNVHGNNTKKSVGLD